MPSGQVSGLLRYRGQRGFSLIIALLFVAFFGAILATIALYNRDRARIGEADVAGWEAVMIGKAARVFVRDQLLLNPNYGDAGPQRITVAQLRANGYLPVNFGRPLVGGREINALGQEIWIVAANWSPTGAATDGSMTPAQWRAAATTVPAAFVYFRDSVKTNSVTVVNTVNAARNLGASITAPRWDAIANANTSQPCRTGGPSVGLWDTGCMTAADFAIVMAPVAAIVGALPFREGDLVIPSWKTIQPDLRAVMRYPQPENPGFSTMLTDLHMGNPIDTDGTDDNNCTTGDLRVTTVTSTGGTNENTATGLCQTTNDVKNGATQTNNRFDILAARNIAAERLIAEPQAGCATPPCDVGGADTITIPGLGPNSDIEALRINGTATMHNDMHLFEHSSAARRLDLLPAAQRYKLNFVRDVAVERNAYVYARNTTRSGVANIAGSANASTLVTDDLNTRFLTSNAADTLGNNPKISVTQLTAMTGSTSVTDGNATNATNAEFITDIMIGSSARLHTNNNAASDKDQVQVTDTLTNGAGLTLTVRGSTPLTVPNPFGGPPTQYSALLGQIADTNSVTVTGTGLAKNVARSRADLHFTGTGMLTIGSTASTAGGITPIPRIEVFNAAGTATCRDGPNVADACPNRDYFPPNITP